MRRAGRDRNLWAEIHSLGAVMAVWWSEVVTPFDKCRNVTEGSRSLEGDQRSVRPTMSWNKDKVRQVQDVILS